MLIEAKLFSMLLIVLDQYQRTQSLAWPLDFIAKILQLTRQRLGLLFGPQRVVVPVDDTQSSGDSNQSLELTLQQETDVSLSDDSKFDVPSLT